MSVTATTVLNMHLDLIERYRHPHPDLTAANLIFGLPDGMVLRMLGTARTYQVTEPMTYLANHLMSRQDDPVLGELDPAEFPYRNGFLWMDEPIKTQITGFALGKFGDDAMSLARIDTADEELVDVHAISWLKTEAYSTKDGMSITREQAPKAGEVIPDHIREALEPLGGRREWHTAAWVIFWIDPPDDEHRHMFGPLFPCGWVVFPGYRARTRDADQRIVSVLRALWALMDMELATSERHEPNRQTRKYAARIQVVPDMRIITLRRVHKIGEPTGEHRQIEWTCRWLVRAHTRRLQNGKTTRVRAYIKGPDNKPLRLNEVADAVLWKLRR